MPTYQFLFRLFTLLVGRTYQRGEWQQSRQGLSWVDLMRQTPIGIDFEVPVNNPGYNRESWIGAGAIATATCGVLKTG